MGEKISVPANEQVGKMIWQMYGLASALEALGGDTPKSSLPGFMFAHAIVERELADMRAQLSGAVYRCVGKAGHDVGMVASVHSSIKDSKPFIEIEIADLVDAAEAAE
jgi:hypothetical protein